VSFLTGSKAFTGILEAILPETEILSTSALKGATKCFNHAGKINRSFSLGK